MRRAPIVLTATVLGTAGVLLFKPLPVSTIAGTDASTSGTSSTSGSSTGSRDTGSTGSDATASSGSATSDSSGSASDSGSTGSSPVSTVKDGTYTGEAETVRYGTTQVEVTISDGRITAVTVVQENQGDGRSVQISENAFPILRSEVLAEQTAAVDTVSGATYTSDQYEASLQSALDRAGYSAPDGSTASTDVSDIQEGSPGAGFGH